MAGWGDIWYGLALLLTGYPQPAMAKLTVAIAADHAGFPLMGLVREEAVALGFDVLDLGTNGPESVDYPDFGRKCADTVASGRATRGIVICGTGIGISIAANRNPGVRAALCHDTVTARMCRLHNDANILALGARIIGAEVARDCVRTFLTTEFEGGRHAARVNKLGDAAALEVKS